jgi:hypothetical protein
VRLIFRSTKCRQNFYAQLERQGFHTAWVKTGSDPAWRHVRSTFKSRHRRTTRLTARMIAGRYSYASSRARINLTGGISMASIASSHRATEWMRSTGTFRCASRSSTFGISA